MTLLSCVKLGRSSGLKLCGAVAWRDPLALAERFRFGKHRVGIWGTPKVDQDINVSKINSFEDPTCKGANPSTGPANELFQGQCESARKILDIPCFHPDYVSFVSVLRCCGHGKTMSEGKAVHAHIVCMGLERDTYLGNLLVQMYGKGGTMEDAFSVFAKILEPNMFSFALIIGACAHNRQSDRVFQLYTQMQLEGLIPDKLILVSIISACASQSALVQGKQLHSLTVHRGFESHVLVGTALVNMYAKCNALDNAWVMFGRMPERNVVSWNVMIMAFYHDGQGMIALKLFHDMLLEGLIPDRVTFVTVMNVCASQPNLIEGKRVHACIVGIEYESDVVMGTCLTNFYGKCCKLEDASMIFDSLANRDVVTWTAMIAACAQHGDGKQALRLFKQMQMEGMLPNNITLASILNACVILATRSEGQRMHVYVVARGFESDVLVGTALIDMYGKCHSIEDANMSFDQIPRTDIFAWTAIIAVNSQHGRVRRAVELFQQMQIEGMLPDKVTFVNIVDAFCDPVFLLEGQWMHTRIVGNRLELDIVLGTVLINMYAKCGSLEHAWILFDKMPEQNLFTWNAIIGAYAQHGNCKDALKLFRLMDLEGMIPDKVTFVSVLPACGSQTTIVECKQMHCRILGSQYESDADILNSLISMYANSGSLEEAWRIFDNMHGGYVVSWNAIISAYTLHGQGKKALQLFQQMQLYGVIPDRVTFVSVLSGCASLAALSDGKRIHSYLIGGIFQSDTVVGNALLNMYGKCGSPGHARRVFDLMPERDVTSWNSMIAAYARHGHGKEALDFFQQMQLEGAVPDSFTFLSILFACNHAGLVDEGSKHFVSMCRDHRIMPSVEHYNCLIDLVGRVGRLDEAEAFINYMPFQPTVASWMALLAACKSRVDVERGKRIAEQIFRPGGEDAASLTVLSSIYAVAGKWNDVASTRKSAIKSVLH